MGKEVAEDNAFTQHCATPSVVRRGKQLSGPLRTQDDNIALDFDDGDNSNEIYVTDKNYGDNFDDNNFHDVEEIFCQESHKQRQALSLQRLATTYHTGLRTCQYTTSLRVINKEAFVISVLKNRNFAYHCQKNENCTTKDKRHMSQNPTWQNQSYKTNRHDNKHENAEWSNG
eukprot:5482519-Amphidinium_carterae.1